MWEVLDAEVDSGADERAAAALRSVEDSMRSADVEAVWTDGSDVAVLRLAARPRAKGVDRRRCRSRRRTCVSAVEDGSDINLRVFR